MYNIKRLAYEIKPPPEAAFLPGSTDDPSQLASRPGTSITNSDQIEEIIRRVLAEMKT
jgi:hypothetical protein